jgi:ribosomal protein S18 acetylase RimI-like enzyme
MLQMIELRTGGAMLAEPLGAFFQRLHEAGDERHFHPHPLTREEAERRVRYTGRDLYYVLTAESRVLGYGMLRGWDAGYAVPSLGIAVDPGERGRGLARLMMLFLHAAARRRGADRVRLTVGADNEPALRLYRELGYAMRSMEDGRLEGVLQL